MRSFFISILALLMFPTQFCSQGHEPGVLLVKVKQPEILSFDNGRPRNGSPQLGAQLIKFRVLASRKLSHVDRATDGVYRLEFKQDAPLDIIIEALQACPDILRASVNHGGILAATPGDAEWDDQWAIRKIEIERAWDIAIPDETILVGILDSGLDYEHEDLSQAIWENPNEIPGNSYDDDNNGYVDDVHGWDFVGNDNDPQEDEETHGTRVAGVIAAQTDNDGTGLAGLAGGWDQQHGVRLVPLRIFSATWYEEDAVDAVNYLTVLRQRGNKVIANMSLQTSGLGDEPMPDLATAINSAISAGVIIVAAAGNTYASPHSPYYEAEVEELPIPARYFGVFAVGASSDGSTLQDELRESYSLYSSVAERVIDFVAPVQQTSSLKVVTTLPNDNYYSGFFGTSAASPIVAGVAALFLSVNPDLTPAEIATCIKQSAEKIGTYQYSAERCDQVGYGRINAYEALKYALEHYGGTFSKSFTIPSGETWTFQPGITIEFDPGVTLTVQGRIVANGTSGSTITFTSTGGTSAGSWGSILLSGSGANNSSISYSNILYATELKVQNALNVTIQNSTITNVKYGINYTGSTGSVLSNIITSNSAYNGIYVRDASTVTCNDNTITKVSPQYRKGVGIYYFNGSNGNIWRNKISGWNAGVAAITNSSPHFMGPSNQSRNNAIWDCNSGVHSYSNSWPVICPDLAFEFYYYDGNSIHDNSPYNIYFSSGGTLYALFTYWNGTPPVNFYTSGGSSIDYSYDLTSDPWYGYYRTTQVAEDRLVASLDRLTSTEIQGWFEGVRLRNTGRFEEAADFFASYIRKHPNDQAAYVELYNCYTPATSDTIAEFFENLPQEASLEQTLVKAHIRMRRREYDRAEAVNQAIIDANPNSRLATAALINNLAIALEITNDTCLAASTIDQIKAQSAYLTDIELASLDAMINVDAAGINARRAVKDVILTSGIGSSYDITLSNYPNPFNPVTTLRFTVPNLGHVSIKVFDLLGREVVTLVDDNRPEGEYELPFNASSLSSGIYLIELKTEKSTLRRKMTVLR